MFWLFFLFFPFLLVVQFTQRPRVWETWEEEVGSGEQNNQSEEIRF